ncbi:MAG: HMP-PP phosphatase [Chlamydiia bacterium]|nr:HMP-PP phosphatase [Chlamydiia bacterium]
MRGIIASDIDRTLTNRDHVIPKDVIKYLHKCYDDGFEIVFLTGRTFTFSRKALSLCDFPFHLGVQNGSEVLKIPEKEFRMQKFLTREKMMKIRSLNPYSDRDYLVYSGVALGDFCYYVKENFEDEALEYIERVQGFGLVSYQKIPSFEEIENIHFPVMRLFGSLEQMEEVKEKILEAEPDVSCVILHDLSPGGSHIIMVSEKGVDKGSSLKRLADHYDWTGPMIGCGDDLNDMTMFDTVDISIGMENGHPRLLEKATIIAKPSYDMGIIDALDQAIGMIND